MLLAPNDDESHLFQISASSGHTHTPTKVEHTVCLKVKHQCFFKAEEDFDEKRKKGRPFKDWIIK